MQRQHLAPFPLPGIPNYTVLYPPNSQVTPPIRFETVRLHSTAPSSELSAHGARDEFGQDVPSARLIGWMRSIEGEK